MNISYALHFEELPSPVVLISMFDNSLLVYTEDNTFYHFLAVPTKDGTRLRLCGSIGFEGVVREPKKVRGMSWLIPRSQQSGFSVTCCYGWELILGHRVWRSSG